VIILLDTSSPTCYLTLIDGDQVFDYEWQAGRELARGLLGFIRDKLKIHDKDFTDISGVGVMQGPGSFTGLRISLAVANTIADTLGVPIVGATGDDWQASALAKLQSGENQQIVLPEYDREARITKAKK